MAAWFYAVLRRGGLLLFEEVPRHMLATWAFRTFTVHPRENRFEADEFATELARHGLHGAVLAEGEITTLEAFDARNHGPFPDITPHQWHLTVLPKDNAEAVVDIVRAAAGLPPLYGEHDNEGG